MNIDQSGDICKQPTISLGTLITVTSIKINTGYHATGLLVVKTLKSNRRSRI